MNVYLMKDTVRIDGMTGACLETAEGSYPLRSEALRVFAPTGGYASFQIAVAPADGKADDISISFPNMTGSGSLDASAFEAYIEWFHTLDGRMVPDMLVPLGTPQLPFRIPLRGDLPQRAGAVWVDIFVPNDALAGRYRGEVRVTVDGHETVLDLELKVYSVVLPRGSAITADCNNYADSLSAHFPHLAGNPRRYADGSFNALEVQFVRMAREHRALFHNLNYRHSGTITPGFAPELAGEGKHIRVASWEVFDAHYGPYLDGSAFAGSRVSERPLEFCYLPFSFLWPANYEKWGTKGYRTEYRRILAEFIRHFEEKGWNRTVFEILLNHKKDYRFVPYTIDEIWYEHDQESVDIYWDIIKDTLETSDANIVWRMDSSNHYGNHFDHRYSDWCRMWVVGAGMFNWFPESIKVMKDKGNILWVYGGVLRRLDAPLTSLGVWPIFCMMTGADGFCAWNTTAFGEDYLTLPADGGGTSIFYPGVPFGIEGPVPSIRLKALRNAMQLVDAAMTRAGTPDMQVIREIVNRRFGFAGMKDWWVAKPDYIHTPPRYWDFGARFRKDTLPPLEEGRSPELIDDIAAEVYAYLSGEIAEEEQDRPDIRFQ